MKQREPFLCGKDPARLFHAWYRDAIRAGCRMPDAMALATATRRGVPSVRFVLIKNWTRRGVTFFTNYGSRKARQLGSNPRAACALYWHELGRQVRWEGRMSRLPRAESEAYFKSRPRGSQIGAWASPQSEVLAEGGSWRGRRTLEAAFDALEKEFRGVPVPCPPFWGGYALKPDRVEFWQSASSRLHYRMQYNRKGTRWVLRELAP